jgi:hypothetical protein
MMYERQKDRAEFEARLKVKDEERVAELAKALSGFDGAVADAVARAVQAEQASAADHQR